MRKSKIILFITLLMLVYLEGWTTEKWQFVQEKEGIKIYTREVDGKEIKELLAITRMKTSVDKLVNVYMDIDNHTKWFPQCKSAKLIKRISPTQLTLYRKINNPWPFKDRDYVIKMSLMRNNETGEALIEYEDIKNALPENECCVRMNMLKGYWKFIPDREGYVVVNYQFNFHPGGNAPSTFINMALSKIGFDTFNGLSQFVQNYP